MSGFSKTVTNPVEALVAVGTENTELHEELVTVYHDVDLYRDCLSAITRLQGNFEKAKLWAEIALRGNRLPEFHTARREIEGKRQ